MQNNPKVYFESFEIRPLHANHISQQLIFQTLSCYSEVNQCTLSLHFGVGSEGLLA